MLHIYHATIAQINIHSCTKKFFHQHGNIKTIAVVSAKIAIFQELFDFIAGLFESRCIFHHFIGNTMYFGGSRWNGYLRIDQFAFYQAGIIGHHFHNGNLNNPIRR